MHRLAQFLSTVSLIALPFVYVVFYADLHPQVSIRLPVTDFNAIELLRQGFSRSAVDRLHTVYLLEVFSRYMALAWIASILPGLAIVVLTQRASLLIATVVGFVATAILLMTAWPSVFLPKADTRWVHFIFTTTMTIAPIVNTFMISLLKRIYLELKTL